MNARLRAWLVVAAAGMLAVAAGLVLRSGGTPVPGPPSAPLASPAVAPGTVGGLLPDVVLSGRYGGTGARGLRPAAVLLVRPGCECLEAVRQVVADAAPYRVVTYVVVAGTDPADAELLAARSGGRAAGFADPGGALAAAYRLQSPAALVLVRNDGVVTLAVAAVAPSLRLAEAFRALVA